MQFFIWWCPYNRQVLEGKMARNLTDSNTLKISTQYIQLTKQKKKVIIFCIRKML